MKIEELKKLLAVKNGAQIVTIVAETLLDMKAKDNPYYKNVRKVARINGVINFNYGNAVNRKREKEGLEPDFVPEKRKWGERIEGTPFVSHIKDGVENLYLEIKVERILETNYYLINPPAIVEELSLKQFLRVSNSEVMLRDFNVKDIKRIKVNGADYAIEL